MDYITVPKGEIRDAPEVIESIIKLASAGKKSAPDCQRADSVRRKLQMIPFESLMILFFKWSAGERTPIYEQLSAELYPG